MPQPRNYREDAVKAFHAAMGSANDLPFDTETITHRFALLDEEVFELTEAAFYLRETLMTEWDPTAAIEAFLKELADVQYVLSGLADTFGIDMDECFDRVHRSNMTKLVNGKPIRREDGKVMKGPNYRAPSLIDIASDLTAKINNEKSKFQWDPNSVSPKKYTRPNTV